MEDTQRALLGLGELADMRRTLLRILNEAEPQRDKARRENVCRRIQRLCQDGVIPEPIADLMHLVRRCRNRAEYNDCILEGMEARAIRSAWAAIEDWRLRRTPPPVRRPGNRHAAEEATV